jgi:hypothetical protein
MAHAAETTLPGWIRPTITAEPGRGAQLLQQAGLGLSMSKQINTVASLSKS